MENSCTYCGAVGEIHREHVIPAVFYMLRSYDPNSQWIVPACPTCNSFAGSKLFFSIPEKAFYLVERYKVRFKKFLDLPLWNEEELKGISYKLRKGIEQSIISKVLVQRRVAYLTNVSEYPRDYLRPKWVEEEYKKYLQEIKFQRRVSRKKKKV